MPEKLNREICCPSCGEMFKITPLSNRKKYCSKKCGDKIRARIRRGADHSIINCSVCGGAFERVNSRSRFCSKLCKDRHAREKFGDKYNIKCKSKLDKHLRTLLHQKYGQRDQLSLDYLMSLYSKQAGKCALSGVSMTTIKGEGYVPTNISLDKIDPNLGYTEGNVQLVCRRANEMKSNKTVEDLHFWCKSILNRGRNK